MKKSVFITSPDYAKNNPEALQLLDEAGIQYELSDINRAHTAEEIIERAKDADAILVFNTFDEVNRKVIENLPNLKMISRHGIGIEMIDADAAREKNIAVKNTTGKSEEDAVADFVMGLVINLSRDIIRFNNTTKAGGWKRYASGDLYGKTLGLLGLGKIGKEVALRARAFKMNILAFDVYIDEEFCENNNITHSDLNTVLTWSDFLSLHVPLIPQTRGLIGKEQFNIMKSTGYIINASRGPVIDNGAMIDALKNGKIAGAAVDVYETEPPEKNELFEMDNVICTPHVAGITKNVIRDLDLGAAKNIISTLNGK